MIISFKSGDHTVAALGRLCMTCDCSFHLSSLSFRWHFTSCSSCLPCCAPPWAWPCAGTSACPPWSSTRPRTSTPSRSCSWTRSVTTTARASQWFTMSTSICVFVPAQSATSSELLTFQPSKLWKNCQFSFRHPYGITFLFWPLINLRFLEFVRAAGGMVDAGPDFQKSMTEEVTKLQRLYGGGDLAKFPDFKFQGSSEPPSIHPSINQ